MTRLYIVRHCESLANLHAVLAGRADFDISEVGQKQLDYLSEAFKDIKLDVIYSSPLIRAYKTAQAMNRYSGCEIIKDINLQEVHLGDYDAQPISILPKEEFDRWTYTPHLFVAPNGESVPEVGKRGFDEIKKIVGENPGKTVGIATHGGLLRSVMCQIKRLPYERLKEVNWCDNTGINIVDFETPDSWVLVKENDTSHLAADAAPVSVDEWK